MSNQKLEIIVQKPRPDSPRTTLACIRCNISFYEIGKLNFKLQQYFNEQFDDIIANGPTKDEVRAFPELFKLNQEYFFKQSYSQQVETMDNLKLLKLKQLKGDDTFVGREFKFNALERQQQFQINNRLQSVQAQSNQTTQELKCLQQHETNKLQQQAEIKDRIKKQQQSLEKAQLKLAKDEEIRQQQSDQYQKEMMEHNYNLDTQFVTNNEAVVELLPEDEIHRARVLQTRQRLAAAKLKAEQMEIQRQQKIAEQNKFKAKKIESCFQTLHQMKDEKKIDRLNRSQLLALQKDEFFRSQEKLHLEKEERIKLSLQRSEQNKMDILKQKKENMTTDAMYRVKVATAKDNQRLDILLKEQKVMEKIQNSDLYQTQFNRNKQRALSARIEKQNQQTEQIQTTKQLIDAKNHYNILLQQKRTEFKQNFLRFSQEECERQKMEFQHKQMMNYHRIDNFQEKIIGAERDEINEYYRAKFMMSRDKMLADRMKLETNETRLKDRQEISNKLLISLNTRSKQERQKKLKDFQVYGVKPKLVPDDFRTDIYQKDAKGYLNYVDYGTRRGIKEFSQYNQ